MIEDQPNPSDKPDAAMEWLEALAAKRIHARTVAPLANRRLMLALIASGALVLLVVLALAILK